jgi:hypothetical protein
VAYRSGLDRNHLGYPDAFSTPVGFYGDQTLFTLPILLATHIPNLDARQLEAAHSNQFIQLLRTNYYAYAGDAATTGKVLIL